MGKLSALLIFLATSIGLTSTIAQASVHPNYPSRAPNQASGTLPLAYKGFEAANGAQLIIEADKGTPEKTRIYQINHVGKFRELKMTTIAVSADETLYYFADGRILSVPGNSQSNIEKAAMPMLTVVKKPSDPQMVSVRGQLVDVPMKAFVLNADQIDQLNSRKPRSNQ